MFHSTRSSSVATCPFQTKQLRVGPSRNRVEADSIETHDFCGIGIDIGSERVESYWIRLILYFRWRFYIFLFGYIAFHFVVFFFFSLVLFFHNLA